MQQQHEMQFDKGYDCSWASIVTRGPGPRSYMPSIGTQAFTFFKFSTSTLRSTDRSRMTGNLDNASSLIGWSRWSSNAEQAMRARPLISMAQEPQISSRQFES